MERGKKNILIPAAHVSPINPEQCLDQQKLMMLVYLGKKVWKTLLRLLDPGGSQTLERRHFLLMSP